MRNILDIFKRKEKETDYEVVKSRSGLPMFVIPIPSEVDFTTDEPEKGDKDDWRLQQSKFGFT